MRMQKFVAVPNRCALLLERLAKFMWLSKAYAEAGQDPDVVVRQHLCDGSDSN